MKLYIVALHLLLFHNLKQTCRASFKNYQREHQPDINKEAQDPTIKDLIEKLTVLKEQEVLNPFNAQIQFQIGLVSQLIADSSVSQTIQQYLDEAENSYKSCLDIDPNHPDALTNLGKLLSDRSNDESNIQIVELYQRAIKSSPHHYQSYVNLGLLYHENKLYNEAVNVYNAALKKHPESAEIRYNLAVTLSQLGSIEESVFQYNQVIQLEPYYLEAYINLSALHHQFGSLNNAIKCYKMTLHIFFEMIDKKCNNLNQITFNSMTKIFLSLYDNLLKSKQVFYYVLENNISDIFKNIQIANPTHNDMVNSTAQKHFFDNALQNECFQNHVGHLMMILTNLGQALTQKNSIDEAIVIHSLVIMILETNMELMSSNEVESSLHPDTISLKARQSIFRAKVLFFHSAKVGCKWASWDSLNYLIEGVKRYELDQGKESSLLPFDTLSLPMSPHLRKKIAQRYAQKFSPLEYHYKTLFSYLKPTNLFKKLRLGFLSYDFNDHPTAHLSEGLFFWNNLSMTASVSSVEFAAYNYGKNDNSTYRKNIESYVGGMAEKGGNFFDLSTLSHEQIIRIIRNDKPHILFDMQGFTHGARPEIHSRRVAPIQISFLVYPGTSGANFIDYIIGDKYVTPPEHATHYSEKVNHYREHSYAKIIDNPFYSKNGIIDNILYNHHVRKSKRPLIRGSKKWKLLRIYAGLDPSPTLFVFANFNKQDKLDPNLFSVWMQILSSTPGSILWLLEPSNKHSSNENSQRILSELQIAAAAAGVTSCRILYAPRVSKEEHIKRSAAADLFLDTFTYGAHSTATDALMAGLPVLTLTGNSFASRVGTSILRYSKLGIDKLLVTHSIKDYTDMAILLAQDECYKGQKFGLLSWIRNKLESGIENSDVVDGESYFNDFERLSYALIDIHYTFDMKKKMHVIIP